MGTPRARAGLCSSRSLCQAVLPNPQCFLVWHHFPQEVFFFNPTVGSASLTLQLGQVVLARGSHPWPLYYSIICSLWYQEEGLAMYSSQCNE